MGLHLFENYRNVSFEITTLES